MNLCIQCRPPSQFDLNTKKSTDSTQDTTKESSLYYTKYNLRLNIILITTTNIKIISNNMVEGLINRKNIMNHELLLER